MPNTTISFEFPEYKLKAIEQALQEKQEQKSIQDILLEHIDGLYQRNVPAQARKYLDTLLGDPEQTAAPNQDAAREPEPGPRRQYRRRGGAEQTQEPEPSAEPNLSLHESAEPEQEQAPGLAMNM